MDVDVIMKLRVFQCSFIGVGTGETRSSGWLVRLLSVGGRDFVSMIVIDCFLCWQDSLYDRGFNECGSVLVCVKRELVS